MYRVNHFKLELIIFIHYKPRLAVSIPELAVGGDDLKWVAIEKNKIVIIKRVPENKSVFSDVKWSFDASWGFKGLRGIRVTPPPFPEEKREIIMFHSLKESLQILTIADGQWARSDLVEGCNVAFFRVKKCRPLKAFDMKGCIHHFVKSQIHPFIAKRTIGRDCN